MGNGRVKQFLSMDTLCHSRSGLNRVGMVETEEVGEGNGRLSLLATDYAVWVFVDYCNGRLPP